MFAKAHRPSGTIVRAPGIVSTAPRTGKVAYGSLSLTGAWLGGDARLCELFGVSAQELCSGDLPSMTHPEDAGFDIEQLERIRSGEIEAYSTEKRIRQKDGRSEWVSQLVWAISDETGVRLHLNCQLIPIPATTPIASARTELERSSAILGSIGEAVLACDGDGNVSFVNAAGERLLGQSLDDVFGRPLEGLLRLTDPQTGARATELTSPIQSASEGRTDQRNVIVALPSGRAIPMLATAAVLRAGDAHGTVLVLRDTTQEQRAAEALQRTEASFRALIEASPELIVVERAGKISYANPAVQKALGHLSPSALIDKDFIQFIVPEHRELVQKNSREVGATAVDSPSFEVRWMAKSGQTRTTEMTMMPIEFGGGPAVAAIARDVTERNEIRAQLLRNDRMSALGTLAAGVAHEINNPLTYLLVNLEHVQRRLRAMAASNNPAVELYSDGGQTLQLFVQSLTHAVEGANRVRQIVRDLMTFSQGNVEHRGLSDVRGVLESSIQMAWHEIRHRAKLVKNLCEVPPVEANEARLGQVFLNLLVNAAQAIPEGDAESHNVRVTTRADEKGNVIIEVSDTGAGIPEEVLPRIFDPFFTTKDAGNGMGLGLSISHGIVRGLGGQLTVESAPGKGSVFRVILPAAKSYRGRVQADPQVTARGKRILIIDDEKLVSEAIARVLADENTVRVVADAREALELISKEEEEFDMILCDLMMPVMTGMDLYAEVVRVAPHIVGRMVFMTGGAFTKRARAFLESVSNPCLEKPLEMSKLRSLIARAGEAAVRPG